MDTGTNFYPRPLCWRAGNCSNRPEPDPFPSLSTVLSLGLWQLLMKGDSQLIIKQVKGDCCCHDLQLRAYLLHARKLEKDIEVLDLQHITRRENTMADDLSTKASTYSLGSQPKRRGRDQHRKAGGPGTMEPAKDRRCRGRLRTSQRTRSRSSS
jgi:hypothetical protein